MGVADIVKIEPSAWLREAVIGQGVARLDAMRGAVATRFPQAHERLSSFSSAVPSPGPALERVADVYACTALAVSLPRTTLKRAGAVGLGLLGRTAEALLDRFLPCDEEDDEDEPFDVSCSGSCSSGGNVLRVPRPLAGAEGCTTFAMRVSPMAYLRVTMLYTRGAGACDALFQRISHGDFRPSLSNRIGNFMGFLGTARSSEWSGRCRVFSHELVDSLEFTSDDNCVAVAQGLEADTNDLDTSMESAEDFRMVIKNSFIEFVEVKHVELREGRSEGRSRQRRARSLSMDYPAGKVDHNQTLFFLEPTALFGTGPATISSSPKIPEDGTRIEDRGCLTDGATLKAAADFEASDTNFSSTTVQLRNIPAHYTRDMVIELLDDRGFAGRYNFLYVPVDFGSGEGLGFATVNMCTSLDAKDLQRSFQGFFLWNLPSDCVCEAAWGEPHQSFEECIERYRNSPVMHPSLPDEQRPVVFKDGRRVAFPLPTKEIRRPRIRHQKAPRHASPSCFASKQAMNRDAFESASIGACTGAQCSGSRASAGRRSRGGNGSSRARPLRLETLV